MIAELCDMDRSLMLSIDILPVPTDEAVREIQNKLLGVETNAANWQRSRMPPKTSPLFCLTTWNSSEKKPRRCWRT